VIFRLWWEQEEFSPPWAQCLAVGCSQQPQGVQGITRGSFPLAFLYGDSMAPSRAVAWGWQQPLQTMTDVPGESGLVFAGRREAPERRAVGKTQIAPNSRAGPSQRGLASGSLRASGARDAAAGGKLRHRQPAHCTMPSPQACHLLRLPSHPTNFNHGKLHLRKIESQHFSIFFSFFFFFLCILSV